MKKIISYIKVCIGRINPLSAAALAAFVALSLIIACAAVPLEGEKELYSGIIRFHVLANSNSDYDQDMKLAVRDRVTEYTSELLADCTDIEKAKNLISQNSDKILELAQECISDYGADYSVTLSQGFELYPRRTYGKYTFPAGNYYSVRLKIGNAEGMNWWCVLFPPLCRAGSVAEIYDNEQELEKVGFSDNEISIISEDKSVRTEIRFFILDMIFQRK